MSKLKENCECEPCGEKFDSFKDLQKHVEQEHPWALYPEQTPPYTDVSQKQPSPGYVYSNSPFFCF